MNEKMPLRGLLLKSFNLLVTATVIIMLSMCNLLALNKFYLANKGISCVFPGLVHVPDVPQKAVESAMRRTENCTCVDCDQDEICGGLWKGDAVGGDPHSFSKITLVISHCERPLHWLSNFTEGFHVNHILIISKCGKPVMGAPENSTIVRMPNLGRCDHTYAHYMAARMKYTPPSLDDDSKVVVFLTDDQRDRSGSVHNGFQFSRSLPDMLRIASKTNFACGMEQKRWKKGGSVSPYHETSHLLNYELERYHGISKNKNNKSFKSRYSNFGQWLEDLGAKLPDDLVQVCYGGSFAVAATQIQKQNLTVWSAIEQSLARGDNIEEGHYAERSWAGLLSDPLPPYQVSALRNYSDGNMLSKGSIYGALVHGPQEKPRRKRRFKQVNH
jgi:hypothetical protein